jgi:hypothetical protein
VQGAFVPDENTAPRALVLPPPYRAHWLAQGCAFDEARRRASREGAGCLIWQMTSGGGRAGRLDFAVVLEPDTPLAQAQRAFIVGMVALGDALGAHCVPERAVEFGWPGEIALDRGRLGGMRFAAAETAPDAIPDWMVLGIELIADRDHLAAAGSFPASVSLKEEEFTDPLAVIESFAAYLMLNFDRWTHEGFAPVAARYSARLVSSGALSEAGDLQLDDGAQPLARALLTQHWRDDHGPRL